jgi:hypothetical protein
MANTTPNFNLSAVESIAMPSSFTYEVHGGALYLSSGAYTCANPQIDLNTDSLAPQQTVVTTGFFFIDNYYSPSNPNGNLSAISDIVLVNQLSTLGWDQSAASSGLLPYSVNGGTPTIPLVPGSNPSCQSAGVC